MAASKRSEIREPLPGISAAPATPAARYSNFSPVAAISLFHRPTSDAM
jgi:hypothetical protein